jgi:hypothetical protein
MEITNLIQNIEMVYHNIIFPFTNIDTNTDNSFGVLKIKMCPDPLERTSTNHFVFSVDISSSMNDCYKDNKSKMDYIKFTLENMLRLFAEQNISVHINLFNDKVQNCISNTFVTKDNVEFLIQTIKEIKAISTTNIEEALKEAQLYIANYTLLNPDDKINHIFLTDGRPTIGNNNFKYLKELVTDNSIFIGYGLDHDPVLMTELANHKRSSYYFIDAFEKAGLVYGEIIHNILNVLIEDASIHLSNAEIYDYKTNSWVPNLYIGNLVVESEKIYQIRSANPEKSLCIIKGGYNLIKNANYHRSCFPSSIYRDLTIYAFRQRTQELLYEVNQYALNRTYSRGIRSVFQYPLTEETKEIKEIKETKEQGLKNKLKDFMEIMESYIKEHSLENDKFMKMLYDDLNINYKMIESPKLSMYSSARQTSQGRQSTYTVTLDDSTNFDSPYATQTVLHTMNQMNQYNCDTV